MTTKKLIMALLATGCTGAAAAQTADVARAISDIKRDTTYLYAEATMRELGEAFTGARSILEVKVGDWVRAHYPDRGVEVCIAKAKEHCFEVETRRGDYYRAFVYVKKSDIMPVADKSEVVVFQVDDGGQRPLSTSEEVISEEAPASPPAPPAATLTADEQRMVQVADFYDIEPYVRQLKADGRLTAYGKYATLPATGACHVFVYDRRGSILAVLRKDGDSQLNLNTRLEDNIKNYKNCGAIWLQLKD